MNADFEPDLVDDLAPTNGGLNTRRPPSRAPGEPISLVAVVSLILRRRRLLIALAIAFSAAALVIALIRPRVYTAAASFITQSSRPSSALGGVAAQLGVELPANEPATSPAFYLDLLRSRGVLGGIVDSVFTIRDHNSFMRTTVGQALGVKGQSIDDRRVKAIAELRNRIDATIDQKSGMVTFAVHSPDPELSFDIARSLLRELNRFNLEQRQSQAGMERRFTQARLAEVEAGLRASEDRMQRFLQENRGDYRNSPSLAFEADRLQRDISIRQQVYGSLSQSLEQAKIDEVRDTPVITVIEQPMVAPAPDGRGLGRLALAAGVLGALVGFLVAAMRDWTWGRQASPETMSELAMLRQETIRDLTSPFRVVRRNHTAGQATPSAPS